MFGEGIERGDFWGSCGNWEDGGRHTFLISLFHFCTPIRTFTVFCMRPADTTTAFICRVALADRVRIDILSDLMVLLRPYWKFVEGFEGCEWEMGCGAA